MSKIWNEKGEAVIRKDGTIHHIESEEGRRILRRRYGRNAVNISRYGTIYDERGRFYLNEGE